MMLKIATFEKAGKTKEGTKVPSFQIDANINKYFCVSKFDLIHYPFGI